MNKSPKVNDLFALVAGNDPFYRGVLTNPKGP